MDCHLFRRLSAELEPALTGSRLEKVHQPGPDVTAFTFYGNGRKRFLFLKSGRKAPFLFLSDHKVPVGAAPPAGVMLLRKHFKDRRVLCVLTDWVARRLYLRFALSGSPAQEERENASWLCLDLREGASLLREPPAETAEAAWPELPRESAALGDFLGKEWRHWPVLTPALRRSLLLLPPEEQAALLMDLQAGGGDLFVYEDEAGQLELSAWPLPDALRCRNGKKRTEGVWEDALTATSEVGKKEVLEGLATGARAAQAAPHTAEAKRLARLLAKLDEEEERLLRMRAAQDAALALQARLFLFTADEKRSFVLLDDFGELKPDASETNAAPLRLELNPRLTVRENMEVLFHTAARGKRGLALLGGRRQDVSTALERAKQAAQFAQAGLAAPKALPSKKKQASGESQRQRGRNKEWPKNVQVFRSSDGFLLLRGRDAAGNVAVLKLAAPHDLWLHVGGGPGAHVIIRRAHAGQEIPATTLHEAGSLASLKSWRKDEARVEVISALAGQVHPMRGGRAGEVRVDRYEEGLTVSPDPALESSLAL